MDGDAWYYAEGPEQKGPMNADQMSDLVKSGVVSGDTLVWMQKLPGWMPIKETSLAPLLATTGASFAPPPFPTAPRSGIPAFTAVNGSDNDFIKAIKTCFAKFITWQGRASRPEFWYFFLFCFGVSAVASALDAVLFSKAGQAPIGVLGLVADLAFLLPSFAASVRRLHDTDRSAWWLLLYLVPLVGFIVLIVFYCQRGTAGRNRYGEPADLESAADVF